MEPFFEINYNEYPNAIGYHLPPPVYFLFVKGRTRNGAGGFGLRPGLACASRPKKPRQVFDEILQRAQGHQAKRVPRLEDGEDGEAVRRSPEGGVSMQPLYSEADPHSG